MSDTQPADAARVEPADATLLRQIADACEAAGNQYEAVRERTNADREFSTAARLRAYAMEMENGNVRHLPPYTDKNGNVWTSATAYQNYEMTTALFQASDAISKATDYVREQRLVVRDITKLVRDAIQTVEKHRR